MSQLDFYSGLTMVNAEKTHQWHCEVHDYVLYTMVKTAQISDLNVHVNLIS